MMKGFIAFHRHSRIGDTFRSTNNIIFGKGADGLHTNQLQIRNCGPSWIGRTRNKMNMFCTFASPACAHDLGWDWHFFHTFHVDWMCTCAGAGDTFSTEGMWSQALFFVLGILLNKQLPRQLPLNRQTSQHIVVSNSEELYLPAELAYLTGLDEDWHGWVGECKKTWEIVSAQQGFICFHWLCF